MPFLSPVLNWLFATMGPWIALKLLKPEVVAQLSYDFAKHVVKKTPTPSDDEFLDHVADYLEIKK